MVWGGGGVAHCGSFGLGGFVCLLSRALFGHTLSERRGGVRCSTPHGFAYCESSSEWWVGSPAGQYLSLLVLHQSSPGIARPLSHRLVSAETRALTATRPLGHSPAFPHLDVRRVYLIDSFIAHDPRHNAHTTSLVLTLSGTPSAAN